MKQNYPAQLINFKELITIESEDFYNNFDQVKEKIFKGYIYKVKNNKKIIEIKKNYIDCWLQKPSNDKFRENVPELYNTQLIQNALFSEIKDKEKMLVDSRVRLRRTVGEGAFVGPHLDAYESLPVKGINFWTSFMPIKEKQGLTIVDKKWQPAFYNQGNFKNGVSINTETLKLEASKELIDSSFSFSMDECEYLVFASGMIPHCSPFINKHRITADQRIVYLDSFMDTNFGEVDNYYLYNDQKLFINSIKNSDNILKDKYKKNKDAFYNYRVEEEIKSNLNNEENIKKIILSDIDPILFLNILKENDIYVSDINIQIFYEKFSDSVSILIHLLNRTKSSNIKKRIIKKLLKIAPESPVKYFRAMIKNYSFLFIFKKIIKQKFYSKFHKVVLLTYLFMFQFLINLNINKFQIRISYQLLRIIHPRCFLIYKSNF